MHDNPQEESRESGLYHDNEGKKLIILIKALGRAGSFGKCRLAVNLFGDFQCKSTRQRL